MSCWTTPAERLQLELRRAAQSQAAATKKLKKVRKNNAGKPRLSTRVDALDFSVGTSNCLQHAGIVTLRDATRMTRAQLRAALVPWRRGGPRELQRIVRELAAVGVRLKKARAR